MTSNGRRESSGLPTAPVWLLTSPFVRRADFLAFDNAVADTGVVVDMVRVQAFEEALIKLQEMPQMTPYAMRRQGRRDRRVGLVIDVAKQGGSLMQPFDVDVHQGLNYVRGLVRVRHKHSTALSTQDVCLFREYLRG